MHRLAFYRVGFKGIRYIVGTLSELRAFLQQPGVRYASDPYNPPEIAAEYEGRKRGVLPVPRRNPAHSKSRRFKKPMLRRVFVEDDGHVFAKADATGYLGKINPSYASVVGKAARDEETGINRILRRTKQSKGIYYFPTLADARLVASSYNWPLDRIIEYGKGWAIQWEKGGNYFGPEYTGIEHHFKKRRRNPARPAAKHKRAARAMVAHYGKKRARKVAGGMIGVARTREQREHFVKVRRAINPRRGGMMRKHPRGDEYSVWYSTDTTANRGGTMGPSFTTLGDAIEWINGRGHGLYDIWYRRGRGKRVLHTSINKSPRPLTVAESKRMFEAIDYGREARASKKNPVRITSPRGGSRQFKVYAREPGLKAWALVVKTNSLKHAMKSAKVLERTGKRIRVTEVR